LVDDPEGNQGMPILAIKEDLLYLRVRNKVPSITPVLRIEAHHCVRSHKPHSGLFFGLCGTHDVRGGRICKIASEKCLQFIGKFLCEGNDDRVRNADHGAEIFNLLYIPIILCPVSVSGTIRKLEFVGRPRVIPARSDFKAPLGNHILRICVKLGIPFVPLDEPAC
jgi:hypothetical protein